jgi:hypothetical protein
MMLLGHDRTRVWIVGYPNLSDSKSNKYTSVFIYGEPNLKINQNTKTELSIITEHTHLVELILIFF